MTTLVIDDTEFILLNLMKSLNWVQGRWGQRRLSCIKDLRSNCYKKRIWGVIMFYLSNFLKVFESFNLIW